MERITGTVVWFSGAKGYGFLRADETGAETFVHYSGIDGDGYRTLSPNQRVSYVIVPGRERRGVMAAEVRIED